ncbi:Capsular associated protein [Pleurostoma richardsiae]|uniref:Capsular associated protein n=1 Tax=Pleurostoma richardsiae TaxID=41990 RepID=A0AA38VXT1_9PEZI|nr:Capsular associated protein [Pleurostoma richardsiae]
MANYGGSQLAALCAAASFVWLSYTLGRQSLYETPRVSAALLLLFSGITTFGVSFFSAWLPGANGRFDDEIVSTKAPAADLPRRPRRFFLPLVIACIALRVEIFNHVTQNLQCSKPGLEVFIPLALVGYDLARNRKIRLSTHDPDDDISNTIFDDLRVWVWQVWQSSAMLLLSAAIFVFGAYNSVLPSSKSTYICLSSDQGSRVRLLQYFGVFLDTVIIVALWRILAWARTTRSRLRLLSGILLFSSFLSLPVLGYQAFGMFSAGTSDTTALPSLLFRRAGPSSIYYFDIFVDSLVFAAFFVSSTLFTCESSPLSLSSVIVFIYSLISAAHKMLLVGTFEEVSRFRAAIPLIIICAGFPTFLYASNIRKVLFLPRAFLVLLLIPLLIAAIVFALLKDPVLDRHPVDRLVYDARIEVDRWLTRASVSKTLPIAVQEYQERNHGRNPPPNFGTWYQFATYRESPIIDNFAQIEDDIWPFWGIKPEKIRDDITEVSKAPGIGLVTVKDGKVSYRPTDDESHRKVLDGLVDLISVFASSLPDMELPINLLDRPRVLTPWDDIHRHTEAAKKQKFKLLSRRGEAEAPPDDAGAAERKATSPDANKLAVSTLSEFKKQAGLACPPGSAARAGFDWNVRDFCSKCVEPHSEGQFLKYADLSRDICLQPDISQVHGFYMNLMPPAPYNNLVPMFSRSKPSIYNDILIPLGPADDTKDQDTGAEFNIKSDRLVWRGDAGKSYGAILPPLSRGGHQERLSHLINNASSNDEAIVLLPTPGKKNAFAYGRVSLQDLNTALPFDGGISDWSACSGPGCNAAKQELGVAPEAPPEFMSRYILLTDGDEGPPRDVLRVLRSKSLPFVASIFKEWYTERLMPWVHYVPIDLRFHGLHSTLAYFTGLKGRGKVNGREMELEARMEDAKWISEQGRRWADKAIRAEDMQIYLFRLLLEWGRLIQDDRDEIGFVLEKDAN